MKEYLSFSSDERDPDYTEPNSYVITLPRRYDNVKSVRLVQATVPNVISNVSKDIDKTGADVNRMDIYFSVTSADSGFITITIPKAHYTKDSVAEKITELLEAARVSSFGGIYIKCRYNHTVKCYEFFSNANFWFRFTLASADSLKQSRFRSTVNRKLQFFGFKSIIAYSGELFTPPASDTFLVSGGITLNRRIRGFTSGDETPESMLWLYIDEFAPFIRSVNKYVDGYFMRIPIPQELEHGSIYHFDTSVTVPLVREFRELKSFDRLTIKLIDHDGKLLDFGAWQHYFTFEIETYDAPPQMNFY